MLVLQLAEHVFVGQSTIGISLFKLETPYADPHVRCCERCDAKTSAYSITRAPSGLRPGRLSAEEGPFQPDGESEGTGRCSAARDGGERNSNKYETV